MYSHLDFLSVPAPTDRLSPSSPVHSRTIAQQT
jgi:hypothetical protein